MCSTVHLGKRGSVDKTETSTVIKTETKEVEGGVVEAPLFSDLEKTVAKSHILGYRDLESRTGIEGGYSGKYRSKDFYRNDRHVASDHAYNPDYKSEYIRPNSDGTLDADRILMSLPAWERARSRTTPTNYHHVYHKDLKNPERDLRLISAEGGPRALGLAHYSGDIKEMDEPEYAKYLYQRYFEVYGTSLPSERRSDRQAMRTYLHYEDLPWLHTGYRRYPHGLLSCGLPDLHATPSDLTKLPFSKRVLNIHCT